MMSRIFATTSVLLVCAALVIAEGPRHKSKEPPKDARFLFLKSLEGTWVVKNHNKITPPITWEYRTTAVGSAIVERIMIGTPMEMLTVYHMNGPELEATHFCALGNQPHYTADDPMKDGVLTFTCDGHVSNSASHNDQHMHKLTLQLDRDGVLRVGGEGFEDGDVVENPMFELVRQKSDDGS